MKSELRRFQQVLVHWYDHHRRELPWRLRKHPAFSEPAQQGGFHPSEAQQKLDPYHVLVSEAMLQQTQVSTVIPYFNRFIDRFPTLASLADADEQDVLRMWQGLGYYSRARNLQRAAKTVVGEFAGRMPETPDALR